jgi:hypothetical protein
VNGGGNFALSDGFLAATGEITAAAVAVAFNPGDLTIQESSTTAVAMPGAVFLAPLVTVTTSGYGRLATNGPSGVAVAANWNSAVTILGIGTVVPGPFEPTKIVGNFGNLPVADRTVAVAGRGLAQFPPFRAIPELGSHSAAGTTEAELLRVVEEARAGGMAVPSPQRSDVIMDFVPFDRAAIGQTIDQFLQQLGDLGARLTWLQGSTDLFVELLVVAAALTVWKAGPKIIGHSRDDDKLAAAEDSTSLDGISGLSGGSTAEEV